MPAKKYKIVVFVPIDSADLVRQAIAQAGAGQIGNYSHASFSSRGIGRFKPLDGANPTIGQVRKIAEVEEERIEVICPQEVAEQVIQAMKKAHPYEEVAYDVYKLENI
ncbi:MAG: hypothetical protein PHO91_01830 [Patescibacteria group bacterium]|nr:hypothetical protein [Patescibacteria group bacterium]